MRIELSPFNSFLNFLKKNSPQSVRYKLIAQITLISFIFSLTPSCSYVPPTRVYAKKDQLYNYRAIALNVSSSEIDVKYSRESGWHGGPVALGVVSALLGSLLGMAASVTAEALIQSYEDSKNTKGVKRAMGEKYFQKLLGDYFIENIRKANSFKVNYSEHKNFKRLKDEGYNALIELNIDEVSLKPAGDRLNIYINVLARMVDLQNEGIIWNQHEVVMSDEEYTLGEYKENGGKILREVIDKALRKIAFRLACNLMYSK